MKNINKNKHSFLVFILLSALLVALPGQAQDYVLDPDWPKPLPEGIEWGQVPNVTMDEEGYIYAFHRAEPPVLKFDPQGNLVDSFGGPQWVALPHGFRLTPDGDIWTTDFQRQRGHTITKIDTDGNILLRLGARGFAGAGPNTFNGPADVAQAENGDFFVADGHWNNRIVKFDKDGRYLMEWGTKGSGPGEFNVPHTLLIDRRGRILVGDRSNERIQIFTQNGEYLTEWDQFGRPSGLYIDSNDMLYSADSESNTGPRRNPGWYRGIRIGSAIDGFVTAFIPDPNSGAARGTSVAEGVTADEEGNVYGAEVAQRRLRKYTLQR